MASQDQIQAAPILPPADFPVVWDNQEDAQLFWTREEQFFPDPLTPMTGAFRIECIEPGTNTAFAAYGIPLRMRSRRINTYIYDARSALAIPSEELDAYLARGQEQLEHAITRLGALWHEEFLPEARAHLLYWERFDLHGASLPELREHLDETVARRRRLREIEMLVSVPAIFAMSRFDDLYQDLFGAETRFAAYQLLQGFSNKSLETDAALWSLSRTALARPEVYDILSRYQADEVVQALDTSLAGQAFLAELREFLNTYGHRNNLYHELGHPSWVEDPSTVLRILQGYLAQPDRDREAEMATLAAERERLVGETRARLNGYAQPVVDEFERLLQAAQVGPVVMEDHNYWVECRPMHAVRRVLLEIGQRLAAAGAIEQPGDVFYLTLDEVRQTLRTFPNADRRQLVADRRAELERFRTISPPRALGTLPPARPPAPASELERTIAKLLGGPPEDGGDPRLLRGTAASPGVARGAAKVVHTLAEAAKLHQGDVLVAKNTVPIWTPLFATAGAVVTDDGGILSHGAIVAREYGIPAVVGTRKATSVIHDGQRLEVDGTTGVVRML